VFDNIDGEANPTLAKSTAERMYSDFLSPEARFPITVDSKAKEMIRDEVKGTGPIQKHLFSAVKSEVMSSLYLSYTKFKREKEAGDNGVRKSSSRTFKKDKGFKLKKDKKKSGVALSPIKTSHRFEESAAMKAVQSFPALDARDNAVKEIFITELVYVKSMDSLCAHIIQDATCEGHFSEEDAKRIFSNYVQIKEFHQLEFFPKLTEQLKNGLKSALLGDLFVSCVPEMLELYPDYVANFDRALEFYNKMLKKSSVKSFVQKRCQFLEGVNVPQELRNLLMLPVQR